MTTPLTAKVVIVGAGISGISTAYHLAKRGVPSTLIDAVGLCPAASGKAGGFLALDWNDQSPKGPLTRRSFALHDELAQKLGPTDIDYRRLTCEAVAVSGSGGKLRQKKLASVEWADIGVRGSQTMGDESTIAQVHPKKLCHALWTEACRLAPGCTLVVGEAGGLQLEDGGAPAPRVSGVQVDGRVEAADAVVLAMGPWSPAWAGLPRGFGQKYHSVVMATPRTLSQAVFFQGLGECGCCGSSQGHARNSMRSHLLRSRLGRLLSQL